MISRTEKTLQKTERTEFLVQFTVDSSIRKVHHDCRLCIFLMYCSRSWLSKYQRVMANLWTKVSFSGQQAKRFVCFNDLTESSRPASPRADFDGPTRRKSHDQTAAQCWPHRACPSEKFAEFRRPSAEKRRRPVRNPPYNLERVVCRRIACEGLSDWAIADKAATDCVRKRERTR